MHMKIKKGTCHRAFILRFPFNYGVVATGRSWAAGLTSLVGRIWGGSQLFQLSGPRSGGLVSESMHTRIGPG